MSAGVRLALGAVEVEIAGLEDDLAEALARRFAPYALRPRRRSPGAVEVERADLDYFIPPPPRPEPNPIRIALEGDRVRYTGYRVEGWFDPAPAGGRLRLSRGTYEPAERAIENFVRALVAWRAVDLRGALVHGASAVWRDRGFLFYGPSGAGKSTLAACNRRARIVSDDLSLLLPGAGGRLALVGSPFRGTYEGGEPVVGSFPLAAAFRLVQAPAAEVVAVPRIRALGELVANLPFVAETFPSRPERFAAIEATFRPVPLFHLAFRRDDDYWDAIEAAGLVPPLGP